MPSKSEIKEKALLLREKGYSYNEILKQIQVSKSSFSLWFKQFVLNEDQKKEIEFTTDSI